MQRIQDTFIQKLNTACPLAGMSLLEVGCGDGTRSVDLAQLCAHLTGVDPAENEILVAHRRKLPNAMFFVREASSLYFESNSFDAAIFTLSFHHVPAHQMPVAIDEAIRVCRPGSPIIFFEPGDEGALFNAEIHFDAWDGDEREVKQAAYKAMMCHPGLMLVDEFQDKSVFRFESPRDFIDSMQPKLHLDEIPDFLRRHNFLLDASRRVNIFRARV
jgi:ubiquinone/menaquinone biosynthesis C-methylase UbiE